LDKTVEKRHRGEQLTSTGEKKRKEVTTSEKKTNRGLCPRGKKEGKEVQRYCVKRIPNVLRADAELQVKRGTHEKLEKQLGNEWGLPGNKGKLGERRSNGNTIFRKAV